MKKIWLTTLALAPMMYGASAYASCGDVTLSAFSWQSAEVNSYVDQFILNNGYGCNATVVSGDTVPTASSMIEKGQPDITPALNPSVVGAIYDDGVKEGRIAQVGVAISDGTFSGWFVPKYLVDQHPEMTTVDEVLKHPDLFPAPEDASKGGIIQGPQGWGDTIVTSQLYKAFEADAKGFVIVPTGSAAALDGVITKAYEQKQGFIATYWSPTSLLAKYPMVRLTGPERDDAEWANCTTKQDCPNPKPNYWKRSDEVTVASDKFMKSESFPVVKDYFEKRSWSQAEVGKIILWMTDNQANGEDGAKWFLQNMPEVWTKWVPADVAEKIKASL